jgi:protein required for attachment to host cells
MGMQWSREMHKNDLAELAHSTGFPRISIYIPTHKVYPETEQDPIRLSNALREAEKQLIEAGVRSIDDLLSSARQRINEQMFWRYQDQGLAVFIEEGKTRWLKLPAEVAELTIVADRFHVLPLVNIFADRGQFHVLAVTRHRLRFFDGGERELKEVDVENLPSSLDEVKERTNFQANVGFHTRDRGNKIGSEAAPKYHALGESPEDYEDVELEHFVREVAKAVDNYLAERAAPLVLAARPRVLGRLRQQLRYRHVAHADIQRDPASMTTDQLQAEAWSIAGPLLRQDRDEVRDRLRARLDGAQIPGSENLQELMLATDEGRVATLLLSRDATIWGSYDQDSRKVTVAETPGPDNEDLLNLLTVKTLMQGGNVISLPEDLRTVVGPVAGLFRY